MNVESTRPRGKPRNRWQDEVREDGRNVGKEEWQEKVYNREEWKKLLKIAIHMPMERMNEKYLTDCNNHKAVIFLAKSSEQKS
jgi:hypothetical protein